MSIVELIIQVNHELAIRGLTYQDVSDGIGYTDTYIKKVLSTTGKGYSFVDTVRLINSICHWANIPINEKTQSYGFAGKYQKILDAKKEDTKMGVGRPNKINYYLDIAEVVLERGTCMRRKFGAVIVKDDTIISTGYVGAPRGRENCIDMKSCLRTKLKIPKGERYELCRSVHAEANAIINASRDEMLGSTMYLVCHDAHTNELDGNVEPCSMCKRLIINAGIEKVIIRTQKDIPWAYKEFVVEDWVKNDESLDPKGGY